MAKSEAEIRRDRLAAALRENLKRRKASKRGEPEPRPQAAVTYSATTGGDGLSPPKPPR